jgi:hypothetical protein
VKQRCRFCRCTWEDGCPVGCSWVSPNLCSVCAHMLVALGAYVHNCRQVSKASLARMFDEVATPFLGTRPKTGTKKTGTEKAEAKA